MTKNTEFLAAYGAQAWATLLSGDLETALAATRVYVGAATGEESPAARQREIAASIAAAILAIGAVLADTMRRTGHGGPAR